MFFVPFEITHDRVLFQIISIIWFFVIHTYQMYRTYPDLLRSSALLARNASRKERQKCGVVKEVVKESVWYADFVSGSFRSALKRKCMEIASRGLSVEEGEEVIL